MNTTSLARHYHALTPWERLPLLVAAEARADDVEQDRLARSAPKHAFQVPDYWGPIEGLDGLAKLYLLRQLDSAAFFWRLLGSLEQNLLCGAERCRQHEEGIWKMIKLEAHKLVVRADGWRLLCDQLQVDPNFILRRLPGTRNLAHTEEQARLLAFSADEAVAYLGELFERVHSAQDSPPAGRREYSLDTAADVARSMRETLNEHLGSWT